LRFRRDLQRLAVDLPHFLVTFPKNLERELHPLLFSLRKEVELQKTGRIEDNPLVAVGKMSLPARKPSLSASIYFTIDSQSCIDPCVNSRCSAEDNQITPA
jgi:hypothetical protein